MVMSDESFASLLHKEDCEAGRLWIQIAADVAHEIIETDCQPSSR
jgi:hypothetical protein